MKLLADFGGGAGFVLALSLLAFCTHGGNAEAATRTALNVVADAVKPVSELAAQRCDAKKELVVAEIRAGKSTTAIGEVELARIRDRCLVQQKAFDRIRILHGQAVTFVEAGNIPEAEKRIDEVRELFRSLSP